MTVFLNKGDDPVPASSISAGTQRHIDLDWPAWKRERAMRTDPTALNAYMDTVATNTDTNRDNNTFNTQIAAFNRATLRLAKYRLADGRDELVESQPTNETDPETGDPIMADVVVQTTIDPLPATVDGWDNTDPENPVAAQVPNPLIVTDDAERASAQAVVDDTPPDVAAWT
jgi:hypothetical protein